MENLIYDWNKADETSSKKISNKVELCDETLRDGIQSPSVLDPNIHEKKRLFELMGELGITIGNIGLPGAGQRAFDDALVLAKHIVAHKLPIKANSAARTLVQDIEPIVKIQQESGLKIASYCFLGSSPIRQTVENWSLDDLVRNIDKAFSYAVKEGLEVAFVTEDTTRSHPKTLEKLFKHAINLGVKRLVLCDTVGHATPDGIFRLVSFAKEIIAQSKEKVFLDWHGHNDRGLAVSNALVALEAGCHRIHGTALGVGERVGNTAMDQLLVNLKLLGVHKGDLSVLHEYVKLAEKGCGISIPYNYPVFGKDAFLTATGVHASAVIKALEKNEPLLADLVYSGVPATWFGKKQEIQIGPMSGASNVKYWLKSKGLSICPQMVDKILSYAKTSPKILSDDQLKSLVD